jgi:Leucine-rich repeat (LRR) protein
LIEQVDGLSSLKNLTDLNLAANQIELIGISLDNLKSIRELNLAGNRIGSFKEVLNLTRLPQLTYCNFSDPNYGENPICSLCNY